MKLVQGRMFGGLLMAGLLVLAACDDDPAGVIPEPPPPAEIIIDPEEVVLANVGDAMGLAVVVLDEEGDQISNPELTFTSSNEDVAIVDGVGLVTAVGPGTAMVTARVADVTADVDVTVEAGSDDP